MEKTVRGKNAVCTASLFLYSVLLCFQSFLNPFSKILPSIDSSVFLYVAEVMENGGLAYADVFDHKGFLLYFIEYVGYHIAGKFGVWCMEILAVFAALVLCFKTARIFAGRFAAWLTAIGTFLPISAFFDGGNYTEEYALPFIFAALYVFTKYFSDGYSISKSGCFILGASLSAVLLLRPNMIAVWLIFIPFIFIHTLVLKKYSLLGRYALWFTLGMSAFLLPFLLYLGFKGILKDFWDVYIIFNFKYTSDALESRLDLLLKFFTMSLIPSLCTLTVLTAFLSKKTDKSFKLYGFATLLFTAVTFLTIVMSGRAYAHYAITLVPCFTYSLLILFKFVCKTVSEPQKRKSFYCGLIMAVVLALCFSNPVMDLKNNLSAINAQKPTFQREMSDDIRSISELVGDNTDASDKIIVMKNFCGIYLESGRTAASRFAFSDITDYDESFANEFIEDLEQNPPKVIVYPFSLEASSTKANDYVFDLIEEKYTLLGESKYFRAFIKE